MSRIEHCREKLLAIVFAILAKKDLGKLLSEMYRRKIIANIARIKNSTRIESCSKNMFDRNFLQKCNEKKSPKIAKVTRTFIATKKT